MVMVELLYAVGFFGLVVVLSIIATVVYYQIEDDEKEPSVKCPKCHKKMIYNHYRWMCAYCGKVIK